MIISSLKNEFLFITKQEIFIFLDKLSKVNLIEVKKVLTKLECNDGLSEYCKNVFINELRILNGVVFASF